MVGSIDEKVVSNENLTKNWQSAAQWQRRVSSVYKKSPDASPHSVSCSPTRIAWRKPIHRKSQFVQVFLKHSRHHKHQSSPHI
jgi:hypothetical protein